MIKQATATFTVTFEYDDEQTEPRYHYEDIAGAISNLGALRDGYEEDYTVVKVEVK